MHAFLVVGPGAVGTYVGGSLALHGYPVVWLVRPHHVEPLTRQGLRLSLSFGEFRLPAGPVVTTWDAALNFSLEGVVLAVKAYHLDEVLAAISPLAARVPTVLCLVNGVGAEERLAAVLGPEKVIPATLLTAVEREGPGHIRVAKFRGMGLAANHPHSRRWAAVLEAAGLNPRLFPNPAAMKWSKLLVNLVGNSLSALLGWPPARLYRHPVTCRLELAQLREALAVMRGLGLPVVDLPKTPVRLLAAGVTYLPDRVACTLLRPLVAGGRGSKMPSFFYDLRARGRTEADAYHGPVVRHGERLGIPTPIHAGLWHLWQRIHREELAPDAFLGKPEALARALALSTG